MIESCDTNPMNLAGTTLKIRMRLIGRFKKTRPFGRGWRMRHGLFELAGNLFIHAPILISFLAFAIRQLNSGLNL
jgi:hypothetical protein